VDGALVVPIRCCWWAAPRQGWPPPPSTRGPSPRSTSTARQMRRHPLGQESSFPRSSGTVSIRDDFFG